MFLDQINESNLDFGFEDHFNDALIEGAVEMESAYYELVTESCQIKFQQVSESTSIEALNEGVIDSIKNFFKKLWNAITKLFSGGSDGSGSTKEEIKKNTELLDYMAKNKEAIDTHAAEVADSVQINHCPIDAKAFIQVDNVLYRRFNSVIMTFYGEEYTDSSNEDVKKKTCHSICMYIFSHWTAVDSVEGIRNAYQNSFKQMTVKEFGAKHGVSMDYSGLSSVIKNCNDAAKEFSDAEKSIKKLLQIHEKKFIEFVNSNHNYGKMMQGLNILSSMLPMLVSAHRTTIRHIKGSVGQVVKGSVSAAKSNN